jgi:hypothetical protein
MIAPRHLLRKVWGPAQEHDVQYLRVFTAYLMRCEVRLAILCSKR